MLPFIDHFFLSDGNFNSHFSEHFSWPFIDRLFLPFLTSSFKKPIIMGILWPNIMSGNTGRSALPPRCTCSATLRNGLKTATQTTGQASCMPRVLESCHSGADRDLMLHCKASSVSAGDALLFNYSTKLSAITVACYCIRLRFI